MNKTETNYTKLSEKSKKTICDNAKRYNKSNYKQINVRVKHDVHARFIKLCEEKGLSQPAMIEILINNCDINHK
ncbi:TPA: RepB family protein [Pasteurella multocida]|nr:CopG family transcriptional regulator [Pasteurella multocida]HDR1278023.1 CopG family transcriptional regulator [Pasteurella multocida]HDR1365472.1 CopG family transcriptional regulator [Pasteurella multocida]HDR1845895.1 CopG family transcriptional regulator [Pasteurella multocida]HDR1902457.1 CopG family transcriptional regulator [Pasteurella multocida]